MAWPPAPWERPATAWRDDVSYGPEPFYPGPGEAAWPERPVAAPRNWTALVREFADTLLLAGVIFLGIRLMVQNFRIEGHSMEPTLHPNQYLLVNKLAYRLFGEPQRGDIVVFQAWNDDKDFIKRIIAIPGDEIEVRDGAVYVNGMRLHEPYVAGPTTDNIAPRVLGPNEYFVMGDNRGNSSDSRAYGALPGERIIGKAWLTYWPPGQIGLVEDGRSTFASTPPRNPATTSRPGS